MAWTFDEKSPIYLQIAYRVKLKIASKELSMGQQLLPVREFAQEAGVNPKHRTKSLPKNLKKRGWSILPVRLVASLLKMRNSLIKKDTRLLKLS